MTAEMTGRIQIYRINLFYWSFPFMYKNEPTQPLEQMSGPLTEGNWTKHRKKKGTCDKKKVNWIKILF